MNTCRCQKELDRLVEIPASVAIEAAVSLLMSAGHWMQWLAIRRVEGLSELATKHEATMESAFRAALDIFQRVGISDAHIVEYVSDLQLEELYVKVHRSA